MAEDPQSAAILAGADSHSASPNGVGATAPPSALPNPAVVIGAALIGGILLAGLIRRLRA
jgi:hypothetical protein